MAQRGPPEMTIAERWQAIGMKHAGMSFRQIGRELGHHHSNISKLWTKYQVTGDVKDRPRSGRPCCTTRREDRALYRLVRRHPFANSTQLKRMWLPRRQISTKTVRRRLRSDGYFCRRPIKRPLLTREHKRLRLAWCQARRRWNLANWRKIHWSDESRFLFSMVDGRVRVWRQRNTAYAQNHILEHLPFGGGSVMIWGCLSHDCKLDLVTVRGNLNADQYQQDILNDVVVPHFDDHPLASRPIFMDDNARPHRARAVLDFLNQEGITTLPWPARSPDLNPIEHVWDYLGIRVRQRDPPVQNLHELEQALHEEWQRLPQRKIQRLVQGMRRRVEAVIQAVGEYIRY